MPWDVNGNWVPPSSYPITGSDSSSATSLGPQVDLGEMSVYSRDGYPGIQSTSYVDDILKMWDDPNGFTTEQVNTVMAMAALNQGRSVVPKAWGRSFLMDMAVSAANSGVSLTDQMSYSVGIPWGQALAAASDKAAQEAGGGGGGYSGPVTVTSVDYMNKDSANSLVDQALRAYLGRNATDQEAADFRKALRVAQEANPTVTTTSETGRVTSGGLDPNVFAESYAKSQEGAAEYQASTKYLDLFLGALSG